MLDEQVCILHSQPFHVDYFSTVVDTTHVATAAALALCVRLEYGTKCDPPVRACLTSTDVLLLRFLYHSYCVRRMSETVLV